MARIERITGWEILNAKGKPTVEAELITDTGIIVSASVPSGASTGKFEAYELYDGGSRFGGKGTRKAAANISGEIHDRIRGMDVADQEAIDKALILLDGTENKSRLGGNAILAASCAVAKAGAMVTGQPVYRHIGRKDTYQIPHIVSTVISGGPLSPSGLEFEDYLIHLDGFDCFGEGLEAICKIRRLLGQYCLEQFPAVMEDAGALAPPLPSTGAAFEMILRAAEEAGCLDKVHLGLDVAASGIYDEKTGCYRTSQGMLDTRSLMDYYVSLCQKYPIIYLEDPFQEEDFQAFAELTKMLPGVQIVGDDLFATNADRLRHGIAMGAGNAILMKLNQAGTVTETLQTAQIAHRAGFGVTASLRSGETTDDFQADVAVAAGAWQMKLGSPVRGERNAKYNRLWRIEQQMHRK